ncbi:hypothetical protein Tco_1466268 [Tanacetum coccineum]
MFEVSKILEDDSVELVSRGANGFVNVSLLNTATSLFHSTFVEFIVEFVASMFDEVLGEGASLSMEVEEEEAPAVSEVELQRKWGSGMPSWMDYVDGILSCFYPFDMLSTSDL